jgi:NAD(P)-dependent dehydrogenase (short-subunit alcohol dehydrogenase family)
MKTLDQFDIKGRSAIVTGAASGIGLAYAEAMVEAGARVTLTDIDGDGAEREAVRLRGEGGEARAARLDVADRAAFKPLFDDHVAAFGGLDIAFANAGVDPGPGFWNPAGHRNPDGQIDTFDPERWDRSIAVNLTGVYNTIREAARVMKAAGKPGSIIATSSNAALVNEAFVGMPYMPAKAGVAHMVRHIAMELAEYHIRVNAIAPGPFVTNIGGGWLRDPVVREAWDKSVPLGRIAETWQIKPLALYLASDASSYMTGSHVVIDGGMMLGKFQ